MTLQAVLAGFAACAGLVFAIGAQNAFVLRQGLARQHVALVIAVCVFGDVSLTLAGVAGVGAIVCGHPVLLAVVRFGGALFLGLYGVGAARRALRGGHGLVASARGETSRRRVLLACLAFTFLNPHVYLDTVVLLGGISTRYPGGGFVVGVGLASLAWFCLVGYGSRLLAPVFRKPAAWRVLDAMTAIFMFVLCTLLLTRPLA